MSEPRILNTRTGTADPAALQLHPQNPRRGDVNAVADSFRENGFWGTVCVDERTGYVCVGNHRVLAARQLGWDEIPVTYIRSTDDEHALRILLADNRTSDLGTYDDEALVQLLDHLASTDAGLAGTGYDDDALRALVDSLPAHAGDGASGPPEVPPPDVDRAAALAEQWGTESGQLWTIGRHRLLIGDCRNAGDVARLLDGRPVNVCVTSPPYASQRKYDEESEFRPIRPDDYGDWFDAVQANVAAHLAPDGSFFLNIKEHCEDGQRHLYVKDLTIRHVREWGWRFVDELCWKRNTMPGGFTNRFRNGWEPVFHFCRQAEIKFRPDSVSKPATHDAPTYDENPHQQSATGSPFTVGGVMAYNGMARPDNVVEVHNSAAGIAHSAQFPIGLPSFFVKAFSDEGDAVYDPFTGSGTTLCATEQEGRDGYGIEISPKYAAVTLDRLSRLGLTPELADA